jgi:diguanylate cyclase (GGDEF)-like protein
LPGKERLFGDLRSLIKWTSPIAVVFVDLDNFKAINDRFGHQKGDEYLNAVATSLGDVVSGRGRLYRYGGDELVALMFNSTMAEALASAERSRSAIEALHAESVIGLTASIGVVSTTEFPDLNAEALVAASDKAAYASKAGGKNRVSGWSRERTNADV